jgi:hypothetical protein
MTWSATKWTMIVAQSSVKVDTSISASKVLRY